MFRKILLNIKTHQATADRRNSGAESRAQRRSDIASALWNAGHGIPCCSDPAKSAKCCPKNNVRIWDWICPAAFFMVCAGPTSAKKGSPEMLHSFCGNRGHCRGNDSCLRCLKNKVDSNFLLLSASGTPWINRLTTWLHPSPSMMRQLQRSPIDPERILSTRRTISSEEAATMDPASFQNKDPWGYQIKSTIEHWWILVVTVVLKLSRDVFKKIKAWINMIWAQIPMRNLCPIHWAMPKQWGLMQQTRSADVNVEDLDPSREIRTSLQSWDLAHLNVTMIPRTNCYFLHPKHPTQPF